MKLKGIYRQAVVYLAVLVLVLSGFSGSKVLAEELPMLLKLETIVEGNTLTGTISLNGWAIGSSGIQKIELSVDGGAKEQLTYGAARVDIGALYPNYQGSPNSGFSYALNTRKYSNGNHKLNITAYESNGKVLTNEWTIAISNTQTPIMGQAVATKDQAVRYFQSKNYVKSYEYINNFVNIVWEEAAAEGIRADVAFAQMMKETGFLKFGGDVKPEQNNFGGIGATGNGAPGHSFKDIREGIRANIQHLKAYASKEPLKLAVVDPRYSLVPNKGATPYVEWLGKKENPYGYGWATGANYGTDIVYRVDIMKAMSVTSGIAKLNQFIIGSNFEPGKSYSITGKGTSLNKVLYQFWIKDYDSGNWTLVSDYSENGTFIWNPVKAGSYRIKINVKDVYSNKEVDYTTYKDVIAARSLTSTNPGGVTIMIDPGHGGTDPGAVITNNGITYKEAQINLQMALKVRDELQNLGYNVVMTRTLDDETNELKDVAKIANDSQADLFVSLHHDTSSNASTNGISTHYSTYKPGIDTEGVVVGNDPYGWYREVNLDSTPSRQALLSQVLATKLVEGLSNSLGYNNLKAHDHNLYVTVNTNMPAVLIEQGYLTNEAEAKKSADVIEQQKKAKKIAEIINDYFKGL